MIDPGTFRRINPNYLVSSIRSRNNDDEDDEANNYFDLSEDSSDAGGCTDCCCCEEDEAEEVGETECEPVDEEEADLKRVKYVRDDKGNYQLITKEEENDKAMRVERVSGDEEEEAELVFTEDELLTASPVVLGWAFNEKLWCEYITIHYKQVISLTIFQWNFPFQTLKRSNGTIRLLIPLFFQRIRRPSSKPLLNLTLVKTSLLRPSTM